MYMVGPKKAKKNVRRIRVHTDRRTKFELADTASGKQRRREEKTERGGGGRETTEGGVGGSQEETPQQEMEEAVAEKRPRAERSEMDKESGRGQRI